MLEASMIASLGKWEIGAMFPPMTAARDPGIARADGELMVAYREGDGRAFRELVERYLPAVLRMMRGGIASREDALDLVQQTFLQLHRARHDYDPARPLRPWVFTIAYNLKREYFRRHKRQPQVSNQPPEPSVSGNQQVGIEQAETNSRVRAAVRELPESQREVIVMHWFEELSFPEIAGILGAKVSAVKVRAHRGYAALRKQLGSVEGATP